LQYKFLILFLLFSLQNSFGQGFYFKIISENKQENKTIDSIGYLKKHLTVKSILEEEKIFKKKINSVGFFEATYENLKKINDSTFQLSVKAGNQIQQTHIIIGSQNKNENPLIFTSEKDTVSIKTSDVENYLTQILNRFEKNGYPLVKLRLKNIQQKKQNLFAELEIINEKRRKLDQIIINGYDKFPKSHSKNLIRLYRNKIFNQENLKQLHNDISKFRFVKQTRFPEILFTKDSTKAYVYLEKNKANSFDGFIGFTNNEEKKIIFNGYLDLQLQNLINGGEKINIFWKSDGNNQRTFNASTELPYIFQSPLGLKAQLNIFKQDSIFQNTQTNLDLGYYFNYNTRVYLGYQETESSDIQNTNSSSLSDFGNQFFTAQFEYFNYDPDSFLFPDKSSVKVKIGTGKRDAVEFNNKQLLAKIEVTHNFYLNPKNVFFVKSHNAYLKSDHYLINELFRLGGINSIRGFNENSLQGNFFSSILTEYRYLPTQNLYLHSIIDYGYLQDKSTNQNRSLLGLGFGFGLLTKNGLFNLVYANGSYKNQPVKLSNSIVQISFKANF
jgi:outer membrane protein assembly factor BamA